jgi:hypothetical protein
MWLRDYLEDSLLDPNSARILTFGYNSKLDDNDSHAAISEFSRWLLEALKNSRNDVSISRSLLDIKLTNCSL